MLLTNSLRINKSGSRHQYRKQNNKRDLSPGVESDFAQWTETI